MAQPASEEKGDDQNATIHQAEFRLAQRPAAPSVLFGFRAALGLDPPPPTFPFAAPVACGMKVSSQKRSRSVRVMKVSPRKLTAQTGKVFRSAIAKSASDDERTPTRSMRKSRSLHRRSCRTTSQFAAFRSRWERP